MAFVERRGDRWRARYRAPDGRERSRTFDRKVDATRFLATVEGNKLRGEWVDPALGKVTFADWSERWLATTVHLKPKTRAGYESLLRTHVLPTFGRVELKRIDTINARMRAGYSARQGERMREQLREYKKDRLKWCMGRGE